MKITTEGTEGTESRSAGRLADGIRCCIWI
jgi:hypothetical protein